MKLKKPIIVYPPPDIKPDGTISSPPPVTLHTLDTIYIINPIKKYIQVKIKPFPFSIPLVDTSEKYDNLNNYTIKDLEDILSNILGAEPDITLRSLYPKTLGEDQEGIGTKLMLYLKQLGLPIKYNYGPFYTNMLEMNLRGMKWCIDNKKQILEWVETEMIKNNKNFIKPIIEKNLDRFLNI